MLTVTQRDPFAFNFESEFDLGVAHKWLEENWTSAYYFIALYVVLVFGGKRLMENRGRFELRIPLAIWSGSLAMFSIMGALRTLPELLHILQHDGFYQSVCSSSFINSDVVTRFWAFAFVLSKVPELGDTLFIVLRKQPLIFLHWYHHILTLLYCFYSYLEHTGCARWFMVMNYCVHSLMYSYYALKASGYKPFRQIAMLITTLQILQMAVGCFIGYHARKFLQSGVECDVSTFNINFSFAMYLSYFLLFLNFFYQAYIPTGDKRKNRNQNELPLMKSKPH